MPYTNEEGGLLNNFAREPKVYQAEPPTAGEKRNYVILGVAAIILVGGLIVVAFSVSSLS
ncbi:photosystem II assembly protein Psb34 [Anabaena subtropica]|uniref:Ssl1498 family light-harvesting-like protein n=1 Tax=Anabaena subtropica FACHB-260 TaxID=2692884 RepID=A0ABR8CP12_9NOST|nr:ssl1498 family light-harvesting-like protein [Anabaena subtropica]MBD2343545.1 ssl1498 family light-harvesting-like protein [Anabaena subtropica FACHB-260]